MEKRPSLDAEKQGDYSKEHAVGNYKTQFPDINERKVVTKIDIRVVPVLCILYLLAFLDRYVWFSRWQFLPEKGSQGERLKRGRIWFEDRFKVDFKSV